MNHLKYRDEQAQVLKHYCITVKLGCKGIFFSLPANICLLNWRHPHQTYAHIYIDVASILAYQKSKTFWIQLRFLTRSMLPRLIRATTTVI
jgi:hypothetical protein